ncbi:MAG: MarR family transcriptional regulator [Leptospirales bacterium]|nr:MarR family transcriptional regulator [Leptospirales bacterium]
MMQDFEEDITVEQWILLNQIGPQKSVSQVDLVDKTFNDRPNVTRLLDGLEKRGLVRREDDSHDRRKFSIVLTPQGKSLLDRTIPIVLEERKGVYKGLSDADLKALKRISQTIESNIMETRPPV